MWGKTSLATPREANFGFFQSLLVVSGIGNSKLVTLRPNMASQWNKSTGQSLSQELVFPQTSWNQEPFGFLHCVEICRRGSRDLHPLVGGAHSFTVFFDMVKHGKMFIHDKIQGCEENNAAVTIAI